MTQTTPIKRNKSIKPAQIDKSFATSHFIKHYCNALINSEYSNWLNWYQLEFRDCAVECHNICPQHSIMQWSGVIAALSPLNMWQNNKEYALRISDSIKKFGSCNDLEQLLEDTGITPFLKLGYVKSLKILNHCKTVESILEVLKAKKTSAFFLNGYRPRTATKVTIDTHMLQIASGLIGTQTYSDATYELLSDLIIDLAKPLGILPHELQALIWSSKVYSLESYNEYFK